MMLTPFRKLLDFLTVYTVPTLASVLFDLSSGRIHTDRQTDRRAVHLHLPMQAPTIQMNVVPRMLARAEKRGAM